NIAYIRRSIIDNKDYNVQLLGIYQQLIFRDEVENNDNSHAQIYLKTSGLVRVKSGKLIISNRIYKTVFNKRWLQSAQDKIKRPFASDIQRWLERGKSDAATLRGKLLKKAMAWAKGRNDITPLEREFFDACHNVQFKLYNQVIIFVAILLVLFSGFTFLDKQRAN
ncbi:MAG: hypothetical protein GY730_07100, partial [bacterium]|nr:hypothetical protein [bacterium]